MKEKIIKIIKEKQKEYEFNSSPYNALRQVEERIKGLTQPSEKPSAEEIRKALKERSQLYTTYGVKDKEGRFRDVIDIDTAVEFIQEQYAKQ
jgi:hypothetical protein